MLALALTLAAVPALAASDCESRYEPYFLEKAGIARPEWERMCARGEDPKRYFTERWIEHEKRSGGSRDAALVKEFQDIPAERLRKEEREALLAVDADKLPFELREPFLKKRKEIQAVHSGMGLARRKCTKAQARKAAQEIKILLDTAYDELQSDECEWLSRMIECTYDEMEKHFLFRLIYDCKLEDFRCFLNPKEPVHSYVGVYRSGGRTREDIVGTQFFGVGAKVISCRSGDLRGE